MKSRGNKARGKKIRENNKNRYSKYARVRGGTTTTRHNGGVETRGSGGRRSPPHAARPCLRARIDERTTTGEKRNDDGAFENVGNAAVYSKLCPLLRRVFKEKRKTKIAWRTSLKKKRRRPEGLCEKPHRARPVWAECGEKTTVKNCRQCDRRAVCARTLVTLARRRCLPPEKFEREKKEKKKTKRRGDVAGPPAP